MDLFEGGQLVGLHAKCQLGDDDFDFSFRFSDDSSRIRRTSVALLVQAVRINPEIPLNVVNSGVLQTDEPEKDVFFPCEMT